VAGCGGGRRVNLTAILTGQALIGLYLGKTSLGSTYGPLARCGTAGVGLLLRADLPSRGEFTQVFARRYSRNAIHSRCGRICGSIASEKT